MDMKGIPRPIIPKAKRKALMRVTVGEQLFDKVLRKFPSARVYAIAPIMPVAAYNKVEATLEIQTVFVTLTSGRFSFNQEGMIAINA
mmetsp:Transcript_6793/g.13419  ORF Transcript_6793/g.13419 Transcript_6793/m.13419 type:complete len:87 (+) Transcript_6793:1495-1755(+)